MFVIGIRHSLRDRTIDPPYEEELGVVGADPMPTYGDRLIELGYWTYIADVVEDSNTYSLYWTNKHGLMSAGGIGRNLYERCFDDTAPSAIVMTADDYRADYDSGWVTPLGAESLYAVFPPVASDGETAGHYFYQLLPAGVASDCAISPNKTWAYIMATPAAGNYLGASSRLSTEDYSSIILQIKNIPANRDGCAISMFEAMLEGVHGIELANVAEARALVRAEGFDYS